MRWKGGCPRLLLLVGFHVISQHLCPTTIFWIPRIQGRIGEMEKAKEAAWYKTAENFKKYLNLDEIYSSLRASLTSEQAEKLRNKLTGREEKINELMEWIPAKGGDWLKEFVDILNKTKAATGHSSIVVALRSNLYIACKENEIPLAEVEAEVVGEYHYVFFNA